MTRRRLNKSFYSVFVKEPADEHDERPNLTVRPTQHVLDLGPVTNIISHRNCEVFRLFGPNLKLTSTNSFAEVLENFPEWAGHWKWCRVNIESN